MFHVSGCYILIFPAYIGDFLILLWVHNSAVWIPVWLVDSEKEQRNERHFVFNGAHNKFYLYSVGCMVKNHSDNERQWCWKQLKVGMAMKAMSVMKDRKRKEGRKCFI